MDIIGNGKQPSLIYAQVANKALSNSDVETSMFNDTGARGSRTIKSGTLKVGDIIKLKSTGIFGDTGTPTAALKIKMNAVELVSSTVTHANLGQNLFYDIEFLITVREIGATGKVAGAGKTFFKEITTASGGLFRALQGATDITVNTTIDQTIDLTYQWGTASASNNLTSRNFTIEIL
jgi:hypothetical protein